MGNLLKLHIQQDLAASQLRPPNDSGSIEADGASFHIDALLSGSGPGLSLIHLQPHIVSPAASVGGPFIFPSVV